MSKALTATGNAIIAIRVDECELAIPQLCFRCARPAHVPPAYRVESKGSKWRHSDAEPCWASYLHERIRELKAEIDGE